MFAFHECFLSYYLKNDEMRLWWFKNLKNSLFGQQGELLSDKNITFLYECQSGNSGLFCLCNLVFAQATKIGILAFTLLRTRILGKNARNKLGRKIQEPRDKPLMSCNNFSSSWKWKMAFQNNQVKLFF